MSLTVVILTWNEGLHIKRALESVSELADRCFVIDSNSTDATRDIACRAGAHVITNPFVTQAQQFNWALSQLPADTDWVLRLDADEYLTPQLAMEIQERLPTVAACVDGVVVGRRMTFQRRMIRYGGLFPIRVLRIFRYGRGECENRWMDEHIRVAGDTIDFHGYLIDDSLNSLSWWIEKHNRYASREAVELLNLQHGFMPKDPVLSMRAPSEAKFKRWLKESVYSNLPGGFRALVYFCYRYFFRLGFLDGHEGAAFHILQGFWYRYLVDVKVAEVRRYMRQHDADIVEAIHATLNINLNEVEGCHKR